MSRMDLREWAKTPDGHDTIEGQKPFCIGGKLWQGHQGACIQVQAQQLDAREIGVMNDVDGTMGTVLMQMRQKNEGRVRRKCDELDSRAALRRKAKNDIRDSMARDKELGLPPSAADIAEIGRIDRQMAQIADDKQKLEDDLLVLTSPAVAGDHDPESVSVPQVMLTDADEPLPVAPPVQCSICDKTQPPTSKTKPEKWLHAHKMGAHKDYVPNREA